MPRRDAESDARRLVLISLSGNRLEGRHPPSAPRRSLPVRRVPLSLLPSPRQLLIPLYRAAVEGVQPRSATAAAVAALFGLAPHARVHIIALGKAGSAMTAGALDGLRARGAELAGGNGGSAPVPSPDDHLISIAGDHPVPGAESVRAADAIGRAVAAVGEGDEVLVMISGGGSSLIAAPAADAPELTTDDIRSCTRRCSRAASTCAP